MSDGHPTRRASGPSVAPSDVVEEGALRLKDAVEWSGVGRSQLYYAMDRGELQYLKIGTRRLIPRCALRDYLASGLEPVAKET